MQVYVCRKLSLAVCLAWNATGFDEDLAVKRSQQLAYFTRTLDQDRNGCCSEPTSIMPMLKSSFERDRREGLLIDVGAHIGRSASVMIRTFGEQMLAHPIRVDDWEGGGCENINGPFKLYAFEPNPEAFMELEKRFQTFSWDRGIVYTIMSAMSDYVGEGILIHLPGADPMASLALKPRLGIHSVDPVKCSTLDEEFASAKSIHLLKIDAEGSEPLVLRGASGLFADGRIKFVVFEFSSLWKASGFSLKEVIAQLYGNGYLCFFILTVALVPISGQWWQSHYESCVWRNVFCGQEHDHDLFSAYVSYGVNRYSMSYALDNLQVMPSEPSNVSRDCGSSLRC